MPKILFKISIIRIVISIQFYTNKGNSLNDQTKDVKTNFSMKLLLNPCIGFFEMQLEEVLILDQSR